MGKTFGSSYTSLEDAQKTLDPGMTFPSKIQHLVCPCSIGEGCLRKMLLAILRTGLLARWNTMSTFGFLEYAHINFFELDTLRSLQMPNVLKDPCREFVQTADSRANLGEYIADPYSCPWRRRATSTPAAPRDRQESRTQSSRWNRAFFNIIEPANFRTRAVQSHSL